MTQLPYRASGNFKKPVECSFTTEPTRRAFLSSGIIIELQVCALPFKEGIALLSVDGFILAFLRSVLEARTGYLSGYISSSALNVRVCRGIAFKVQSIRQRQYIIYCSIAAISTAMFFLFNQSTELFDF